MVTNPWVKGHRHNRHSFCPSGNGCGYTLLGAESGTLSSQNYPGTYPSNIWCKWRLRVPEGRTLRLLFGDFDVESSPSCSNGSLVISDKKGEIKLGTLIRIDILVGVELLMSLSFPSCDFTLKAHQLTLKIILVWLQTWRLCNVLYQVVPWGVDIWQHTKTRAGWFRKK